MKKIMLIMIVTIVSINLFSVQKGEEMTYTKTDSGLEYVITENGSGEQATAGCRVKVHYTGKLEDGTKFDSSLDRGEPFAFELGAGMVIKGWDEGIALMREGDKVRLIIPADLAYGERSAGGVIPPNVALIFDVELLEVK